MLLVLAFIPIAIWIYGLLTRGGFWQVWRHVEVPKTLNAPPSTVVAVVPARNEARAIERSLTSLLQQDWPGLLKIIVVDDNSEDRTGELALKAAATVNKQPHVAVLQGQPLPLGWTGKMWAVAQGVAEAETLKPDFLLLTDADIEHGPNNLTQLVQIAEKGRSDLVSYMVKLHCQTTPEKALIPAFVFFFFMLYPPRTIQSYRSKIAAAAGGCMLIRTAALQAAGGIEQIRSEVIDDCALARAVKSSGGRVWLGLTAETRSLRRYSTFGEIERMIARTAFNQLRHSWLLLVATCLGLLTTYLLPLVLLLSGRLIPALLGLAAWALMSILYYPMIKFYGCSLVWSITLPFAAVFYMAATVHSAIQYSTGRGGRWKGRNQDLRA